MICIKCGKKYKEEYGTLTIEDKYIGNFDVEESKYFHCNPCNSKLLTPETIRKIENKRIEVTNEILSSYALSDFIPSSTVSEILGISRQALHKHRKIRRGFIFQIRFNGKFLYLKKSVLLFKEKGDGRFHIKHNQTVKYICISNPAELSYQKYSKSNVKAPHTKINFDNPRPIWETFYDNGKNKGWIAQN